MADISVLGAGSWGTALAILLARNGHRVMLWGHAPDQMATLQAERCNRRYLPDARFPDSLELTTTLDCAAAHADDLLVVVPSHAFADLLGQLRPLLRPDARLAWATKGLEPRRGCLLHEVAAELLGTAVPAAVLSGPTFAAEVAAGQPTAITIASADTEFAVALAECLHNPRFRAYTSSDIIGVQLGGATKNVLAIAAGVADGIGIGANARAALITRGLAEMMRLGVALGGRPETLTGLAGIGDLILTCTDNQSRNRRYGLGLGQGQPAAAVAAAIGQEIEGIATAKIIRGLAQTHGVDMPITEQTYRVLHEGLPPAAAVAELLLREPKIETLDNEPRPRPH